MGLMIKLRELFGTLLAEVQRIKSEGDFAAGKKLVEEYAVKVDPALHAEVLERYAKLNLAPYKGFVNPVMKEVKNDKGEVMDIKTPTLIEFVINPEELVYPMVQPGGTLEDLIMDC